MIKTDEGKIMIEGDRVTILSDFSIIAKALYEQCDFVKEELLTAIDVGTMSSKELNDVMKKLNI